MKIVYHKRILSPFIFLVLFSIGFIIYEIQYLTVKSKYPIRSAKLTIIRHDQFGDRPFPKSYIFGYDGNPIKLFTYHGQDLITSHIRYFHEWEPKLILSLQEYLFDHPDHHFIDIGSNIGVHTLSIASIGRQVVALDANLDNIRRLAQSVRVNGYQDRVIIVHNALSSHYSTVYMSIQMDNVGGSQVIDKGKTSTRVQAVIADDLLEVIPFKKAVMKIDIEGMEDAMLQHADQLFTQLDIPVVMMEWGKKDEEAPRKAGFIYDFFTSRDYCPYATIESSEMLPSNTTWPWDVVWRKLDSKEKETMLTSTQYNNCH